MKKPLTEISKKWKRIANSWVGDEWGRHCHWCKSIESNDGEVHCINPKSKFANGDRIRTWDGLGCAKECGFFELDDFYKDDKNYENTFKPKLKQHPKIC